MFLPPFTRRAEQYAPERAAQLFALCGGRDSYYTTLRTLTDVRITMTDEQIRAYSARWPGLKNLPRTPGGFTPEDGIALFRELFLA